jgi:single-strand DNA-binding protein
MTGRVVEAPELRHTNSNTPVTSFRIAVPRDYAKKDEEKETDFFDVVAWRSTAEFVCKYFGKGALIQIVGRLENRKWTDKHEQSRVSAELIADKIYFGDSKGKNDGTGGFDPFEGDASKPPDNFDPF